ncbi:hypothetical protein D9619_009527 [Psilocybe cf. subviscida]|uniref:Proteasome subunit beta n=1 Tax=Psilocybe cf. subviscida TaxID=2480587 RepID=A0A8H5BLC3_9AGAR|nr:hypothetical protein D9619_009527 [Psilocybe cf. subviscida]
MAGEFVESLGGEILGGLCKRATAITISPSTHQVGVDEDKIKTLSPHLLMAYSGEPDSHWAQERGLTQVSGAFPFSRDIYPISFLTQPTLAGDTVQFAEYVERNIRLYQIRNLYPLRPSAAAAWIRKALADSLRSRKPYSVNLLLGGYDTATFDPHLYWIDYLGTMTEVPFAAHGYGAYFALSLLDRYHDPSASLEEGIATLKRCLDEVSKRLVVSPGKYKVKVVDKDGVREIEI